MESKNDIRQTYRLLDFRACGVIVSVFGFFCVWHVVEAAGFEGDSFAVAAAAVALLAPFLKYALAGEGGQRETQSEEPAGEPRLVKRGW